jgi:hypothetical protein
MGRFAHPQSNTSHHEYAEELTEVQRQQLRHAHCGLLQLAVSWLYSLLSFFTGMGNAV